MRHASIQATTDIYGRTMTGSKRKANAKSLIWLWGAILQRN